MYNEGRSRRLGEERDTKEELIELGHWWSCGSVGLHRGV